MGITTNYECLAICDECGEIYVEAGYTQKMLMRELREQGWSIGKVTKCPKCLATVDKGG